MSISRKNLGTEIRDYVMIAIGMVSYCIGWNIFLLPNSITTGGVPGIASLLFWAFGIPVSLTYFAINALLLVAALRILGFRFCIKTIYGVALLTALTSLTLRYTADMHLLADQPFMASIIGAIFCGSGVGIALAHRGSTGGTDIVASIVNKYRDISLGRVIMICDIFIISCSFFVFRAKDGDTYGALEKMLYGYVTLYVCSFCVDMVVQAMHRSVQFFIISDKYREIASQIAIYPHRGATVLEAHGFYTGHDVKMLFIMAKRRESHSIFQIINEIDPNAFVTQTSVIGVYGNGFDKFKVSTPKHPHQLTPEQLAKLRG